MALDNPISWGFRRLGGRGGKGFAEGSGEELESAPVGGRRGPLAGKGFGGMAEGGEVVAERGDFAGVDDAEQAVVVGPDTFRAKLEELGPVGVAVAHLERDEVEQADGEGNRREIGEDTPGLSPWVAGQRRVHPASDS